MVMIACGKRMKIKYYYVNDENHKCTYSVDESQNDTFLIALYLRFKLHNLSFSFV